jgi:drug/metabolite transporter (DMT)-like permease
MKISNIPQPIADFSLLAVACIWGFTFVSVKNAVSDIAPFAFNAYRFTLAAGLIFSLAPRKIMTLRRQTWPAGLLLGLFLFGGYSFQTVGLVYTTASNAGFITGLVVVLVPLLASLFERRPPSPTALAGAFAAFAGVAVLSLEGGLSLNPGDILVGFCAVCFALHVYFTGRLCRFHSITGLVFAQVLTVALLSFAVSQFVSLPPPASFSANVWQALVITACFATTGAFFIQSLMQRFTTPVRTAVIFSAEPVFAAFFASIFLAEVLGQRFLLGAALVLAGMLLAETGVFLLPRRQTLSVRRGEKDGAL